MAFLYSGIVVRTVALAGLVSCTAACARHGVSAAPALPAPVATVAAPAAPASAEPMVFGPGDDLTISVWRNTELNTVATVDPAGRIQMPLAGEIAVAGLDAPAVQKEIAGRLTRYLVHPQVSVRATAVRSRKIHVLGEVTSPGTFPFDQPMLPWEAVAKAGGFTHDANLRQVLLIRKAGATTQASALDMQVSLEKGSRPLQALQTGDVLYVLPSRIANVERFMSRLQTIIYPFVSTESAIVLSQDAWDVLQGKSRSNGIVVSR